MNGITVIAGENNTGKSTFGKVLYCIFNAFHDSETTNKNERIHSIKRIFRNYIRPFFPRLITKKMIEELLETNDVRQKIIDIISSNDKLKIEENKIDRLQDEIKLYISINNEEIQKMRVTKYLRQEFTDKVNHVNKLDESGKIILNIKEKTIETIIESDICVGYSDDINIIYDAIYFDTPFVMDDINKYTSGFYEFNYSINHRDDLIERLSRKKVDITLLEEVVVKQKINNILSNISSIVSGEFKEDDDNLYFIEKNMKNPIPIQNISTGLKTFLIIKRLLEMGQIKERGVLILDEPEIHLHPDWQIKLAEILVLLQKEFNLTILLTTHSPYFLHAIEVYSEKYTIAGNTNYYLAKNDKDFSCICEVSNNIDDVYQLLSSPFQKLDDISYQDNK